MHTHMNARTHMHAHARNNMYVFILTVVYEDLVFSQPAEELHPYAAI